MGKVSLFGPLPHQQPMQDTPARWPVWRGGRRSGKTEWAGYAITHGRGPVDAYGVPMWRGLKQGLDAAWIVRDFTQSEIFWHEFIIPAFGDGCQLNATNRTVDVPSGGRLWIRSSENIESIRGMGKNLGCVIFEEAAYYHSLEHFRQEVRPMLMDNKGWAAWISSTKGGSEFNQLCTDIIEGKRTAEDGWVHFHTTPYDNPLLDPEEIKALIAEYDTEAENTMKEEVFAELLGGGAGLAFPEWRSEVHTQRMEPIPANWEFTAGLDWGFTSPGVCVLAAHGPNKRCHLMYELVYRGKTSSEVGWMLGLAFTQLGIYPDYIAYDEAMDHDGPTLVEGVQTALTMACPQRHIPLISVPKGKGSRVAGKDLVHKILKYKADDQGVVHSWGRPQFSVDPVRCPYVTRTMPKLRRDEKKPEDVDTNDEDHGYDALRYLLMARTPVVYETSVIPTEVHPGFIDGTYIRRDRLRNAETELKEQRIALEARGLTTGGRYQRPRGGS